MFSEDILLSFINRVLNLVSRTATLSYYHSIFSTGMLLLVHVQMACFYFVVEETLLEW